VWTVSLGGKVLILVNEGVNPGTREPYRSVSCMTGYSPGSSLAVNPSLHLPLHTIPARKILEVYYWIESKPGNNVHRPKKRSTSGSSDTLAPSCAGNPETGLPSRNFAMREYSSLATFRVNSI
jgi:hypothetical protein